ncbi:TRAP transporter substrate-binding protein [Puniceibacterium sp. IMCC21224]|uniref:TRAP transporter substrate-binding protein n=1 Tax=Puniceibacterium sp. IMCC21224 TaxID=1618204 RepID=UPI00064D9CA1|nr:TRAP transporter substrate-binding protein [Puniceibacterium sp. IMCC21224]KMK68981.1 TRAP-type C4-dicarboxylate transport system, periplasmic component [Puniceibacterium sp. IMCC21224]
MKAVSILAVSALTLSIAVAAQAADIKIAFNSVDDPASSGEATFAHAFADALEGTDFKVDLYPSETLGKEKERLDQVSTGLLEINLSAISTAYAVSPALKGITLPFYFDSNAQLDAIVAQGPLMETINAPLLAMGVNMVGINFIGTPMGIHNAKKDVATVADLADLRFRALNPEQLDLMEALGSNGTIIAWAEVANAIQTGVADGYFNPPSSAIRGGHTGFLTHYTPADLFPSTRAILMSDDWYNGLSDDEKSQIDEAIKAGLDANRAWLADWTTGVAAVQTELGVTITPLAAGERDKMKALAEPLWATTLTADQLALWQDAKASVE